MNLYTFFSFIATPLGYLLNAINSFCHDYGIAIIIFTLIVRGALFPLYASQIKGQMKMAAIQPKMQMLQKKYADNKEELGRKMQELYKQENYNPMSGCLPLVIQMPILMGLFYLLRNPGLYLPTKINLIIASHESFLWIPDLSQPDQWILPIITGVTTFASMSMTGMMSGGAPTGGGDAAASMAPMMKVMRVFMPIFIVVMARSMPSGLAVYWFIGNLFTVVQTWLLKNLRTKAQKAADAEKGPAK
ncbi:membrane protein [Clostridia bacterium]|nr:membrane protein [Clostridia bacterium]